MSYYIVYPNAPMVKGTDWYLGIEKGMYDFKPASRQNEAFAFESKDAAEGFLMENPQFKICDDGHLSFVTCGFGSLKERVVQPDYVLDYVAMIPKKDSAFQ